MEDFVTFDIAKKLKENGFDWETSSVYERNILACRYEDYPKPTISQVLKWLRDEKKLYLAINYVPQIMECSDYYFPTIQYIGEFKSTVYTKFTDIFKTYEECALVGIEYVLDNLI